MQPSWAPRHTCIALEGHAGIPEAERHPDVAVAALGGDEGRFLLVLDRHQDLVVPGEGMQETQRLAAGRGIHDLVDARQRERVLGVGLVQVYEVDAESQLGGHRFRYHHRVKYPSGMGHHLDDTSFQ